MRTRVGVGGSARLVIIVVAAMGLAASLAAADPSADRRNLGLLFGARPATLDMQSLAALSTCVTGEIQARAASPGQMPSPDPQGADQPAGPVPDQADGTWSTPPPWKGKAGDSKPWGEYDK